MKRRHHYEQDSNGLPRVGEEGELSVREKAAVVTIMGELTVYVTRQYNPPIEIGEGKNLQAKREAMVEALQSAAETD